MHTIYESQDLDIERLCMRDLVNFSHLLDREKQFELARTYRLEKDPEAREKLIRAGVRWAMKLANVWGRRYDVMYLYLDLVEEALIGLIAAVDKFRPEMDVTLSTYATWWIKQKLGRFIINNAEAIRLPVHAAARFWKLRRFISHLERRLERKPTDAEIVAEGFDAKVLERMRKAPYSGTVSLSEPIRNNDGDSELTFADIIPDRKSTESFIENIHSKLAREKVVKFVHNRFSERNARIFIKLYGLDGESPQTLESVGEEFGLTRERARQIAQKILTDPAFVWFTAEVFNVVRRSNPVPLTI